jgi:hypothetical protein
MQLYLTYQWWKGVPGPECYHKPKPGEEEDPTIHVDGVEGRDRSCFPVDRVDLRGPVKV